MEGNLGQSFRTRRRKHGHPRSSFHNPVKDSYEDQWRRQPPGSRPPLTNAAAAPSTSPPSPSTTKMSQKAETQTKSSTRAKKASPPTSSYPSAGKRQGKRKKMAFVDGTSNGTDISGNDSSAEGEKDSQEKEDPPVAANGRRKLQKV